ncbi:hypothetical protein NBRC10512_002018 [Rhodotorula toruloides]|uniref:RHTO0S06e02102g1_1 n=2 Tax=Rhodotorula toruloides TaxID=5286 RepID=A0A061B1G7_RHOTO|nr:uncharacterized protein RHTO_06091 [Rhodotorula toruloides NP11]EMS24087.1 hypothetical protein RHTO_06091 [Rhodotorula toruloides NP11]KAJ8293298.1 hypothetical protein OF846_003327 [Rhodotorula toruloides]CDR41465.1 RHTO0S06e02102g1_1 [Rhodotorula toruloides]
MPNEPSNIASTTSTATVAEGGIPTLFLRGEGTAAEQEALIREHSARQQAQGSVSRVPEGLRADREYRERFEGGNPDGWPVGRGVPDFQPLDRNRDAVSRPLGASTDQRIFVSLMMTGVFVIGQVHTVWAKTVGRLTSGLFKYPIGGSF